MKTYVLTTGTIFGLLAIVHLWRAISESGSLARDPWFLIITVLAATLCLWAFGLLRRSARAQ
jgi:uncharacterized membrane protein